MHVPGAQSWKQFKGSWKTGNSRRVSARNLKDGEYVNSTSVVSQKVCPSFCAELRDLQTDDLEQPLTCFIRMHRHQHQCPWSLQKDSLCENQ